MPVVSLDRTCALAVGVSVADDRHPLGSVGREMDTVDTLYNSKSRVKRVTGSTGTHGKGFLSTASAWHPSAERRGSKRRRKQSVLLASLV